MKTLNEIYNHHDYNFPEGHGYKGTCHSYIDVYEKILAPYRNGSTLLEIGVYHGLSIRMWKEYFIDSTIVGVDIQDYDSKIEQLRKEGFDIILHDASKESFLDEIKNYEFDIVIDDGSHWSNEQIATFKLLKPKMKKGGIYIIEDIVEGLDIIVEKFKPLHDNMEVIDLRHVKNRFDDILIIFRF